MTISQVLIRTDLWILDRIFQPVANRLPERLPATECGMSCLFGALMLSAVAIVSIIFMVGMSPGNITFNMLTWVFGLSFYLGISRVRSVIRPGQANPLRVMLLGMRLISIPFAAWSFWQSVSAPAGLMLPLWFNFLANLVFVTGIYLVSCQLPPPAMQREEKTFTGWETSTSGNR
ncbi:hypothetical protein LOC54_05035 [Acetobacter sp. AN02]|uniref:hypothetical protein n=1 Tax=Acetobacter sp. AN02 TaxID=2894186 RepID=UPI0024344BBA|nr:hypothetical protein [Acetobacter sp. AN02]MDG6094482.1 hypothetical protein [Acetobacter sp. AN02]